VDGVVHSDAQSRRLACANVAPIHYQRALALSRGGGRHKANGQRVHLIPDPVRIATGPDIQRPGQHAGPVAGRFGQPDVKRMVGAAETLQELRVTILRQREFGGALVGSSNLPQWLCR